MDFDEIMRQITFGLSNNNEQDIPYLLDQMEKIELMN